MKQSKWVISGRVRERERVCVCERNLENGTWVPEEARQHAVARTDWPWGSLHEKSREWLRNCYNIGEEANAVEERRNATGDRCSVSGKRRVKACGCSRSAICAQTPRLYCTVAEYTYLYDIRRAQWRLMINSSTDTQLIASRHVGMLITH